MQTITIIAITVAMLVLVASALHQKSYTYRRYTLGGSFGTRGIDLNKIARMTIIDILGFGVILLALIFEIMMS